MTLAIVNVLAVVLWLGLVLMAGMTTTMMAMTMLMLAMTMLMLATLAAVRWWWGGGENHDVGGLRWRW